MNLCGKLTGKLEKRKEKSLRKKLLKLHNLIFNDLKRVPAGIKKDTNKKTLRTLKSIKSTRCKLKVEKGMYTMW